MNSPVLVGLNISVQSFGVSDNVYQNESMLWQRMANSGTPVQVHELLQPDENVNRSWESSGFKIYATDKRLFFIAKRGKETVFAPLKDLSVKPNKRRFFGLFLLGLLLLYLGFFTQSFGPIVAVIGAISMIAFFLRPSREFIFNIPGRKDPIIVRRDKHTEEVVQLIEQQKLI
ncbi:MAG: hypothetical protein ACE5KO_06980 [Candidatus Bathyarchaeia archaeon]